jgi:hypothetical protein
MEVTRSTLWAWANVAADSTAQVKSARRVREGRKWVMKNPVKRD